MRVRYSATLFGDEVGDDLLNRLCAISPEGRRNGMFEFSLTDDDPRTGAILDELERDGLRPRIYLPGFTHEQTFLLRAKREYEMGDFEAAEYLCPAPRRAVDAYGRAEDGTLFLASLPRKGRANRRGLAEDAILDAGDGRLVVSPALRDRIEAAGLVGPAFRPTLLRPLVRGRRQGPQPCPYWELTSDLRMPPLSDRNVLFGLDGVEPYDGDPEKGWLVREGRTVPEALFVNAEYHYDRAAVTPIEPLDLALTHERLDQSSVRWPVASRRFYEFCAAEGLAMDWTPVRIDEDE